MRTGVLSDAVIRNSYPEFFPLEMGLADAIEEVVFEKHHLTGIRLPKEYKRRRNSRFPINDINNFTVLSGGADTKERNVYQAIQAYRKRFGSTNYYEDASQNQQYNDIMYMGKNYEMRRRGLVVDKLDMDSLPQAMIMSRMLSRNKDEIIDMNRKTRSSTVSMSQLENNMNSAITSNLEGAKAMLLKVAPEQRKTDEFMRALENVSLLTKQRRNDKLTRNKFIDKRMPLNTVELPTDTKYEYGSARDVILEDEYLRISGLSRPIESITMRSINPADDIKKQEFYSDYTETPSDYIQDIKDDELPQNSNIRDYNININQLSPEDIEQLKEIYYDLNKKLKVKKIEPTIYQLEDLLAELRGDVFPPYQSDPYDYKEDIPQDFTKYIEDETEYKKQIPDNTRQENLLKQRLARIKEKEEGGERLAPHDIRMKSLLTSTTREELYKASKIKEYTETNIDLTDQAIETVAGKEIRKKKAFARKHMEDFVAERNPTFSTIAPHHGEADVDGSGYVRIHPTNSLIPSVLGNRYANPMTAQERANNNLMNIMSRATAQEMYDDGLGMD